LLYVTCGFAVGNFKTPHVGTEEAPEEHLGGSRTGWTLGGGTEYAFNNNWTAGIEYRYTDWGTEKLDNYPRNFGAPPTDCQCDVPTKLTDNRVTVSLSYEF
jgi:outer membrane immunogenic protein